MASAQRTTIQVSEGLRRRLRVLASLRDVSYEDAISGLLDLAEAGLPFRGVGEFAKFFEENPGRFGFGRVLERVGEQRFRVADRAGAERMVQLELFAGDFSKRADKAVDYVVALFSASEEVEGVPVIALLTPERVKRLVEEGDPKSALVPIPTSLYKRIEGLIEGTGFTSVPEYVVFVLREVVADHEKERMEEPFTKEDVEKIKERLRALGYL